MGSDQISRIGGSFRKSWKETCFYVTKGDVQAQTMEVRECDVTFMRREGTRLGNGEEPVGISRLGLVGVSGKSQLIAVAFGFGLGGRAR